MHIPVYRLAKKYQIRGLMQHCVKKFKHEGSLHWDREWFQDILLDLFGLLSLPSGNEMKDAVAELALDHSEDLKRDFWLPKLFSMYPEFRRRVLQKRCSRIAAEPCI
jgi:hypothetical protein